MEARQLANLLIKILGLYFFLNGVCNFIVYIPSAIWMGTISPGTLDLISALAGLLPNALQIVIGIILIAKCKKIAPFLFRDETGKNP